jgi:short-subunit dehydrogenase
MATSMSMSLRSDPSAMPAMIVCRTPSRLGRSQRSRKAMAKSGSACGSPIEVNVFGAVAIIKAVLPFMRKRRESRILNVTSMGGLMTMPGLSYYHGSKFALEGTSSSLAKEVRALGIFVTAVEAGMFRTDWAGRSMVRTERQITDYDPIFDPIRAARKARSGQ